MTTLVRREPFRLDLPEWMTAWLDDRWFPDRLMAGGATPIRVEELAEDGNYLLRAELPGVDPDKDVHISLEDGMLHVAAERTENKEERSKDTFRSEFRYGRFERTIPLPKGAAEDKITATYKDGVLEVRVPVEEATATEPATVPVQRG